MDQKSFEEGLLLGIGTAIVVLEQRRAPLRDIAAVREQKEDLKRMITTRRNNGIDPGAPMVAADIYMPTDLAHPEDFGLPPSSADEFKVALSQLRPSPPIPPHNIGCRDERR